MMKAEGLGTARGPAESRQYRFHTAQVYRAAAFSNVEKVLPQEPVTPDCDRTAAQSRTRPANTGEQYMQRNKLTSRGDGLQ
jgi:hypothetical protein